MIHTNSQEFATVARTVFADLLVPTSGFHVSGAGIVVFETVEHRQPELHWSIHRDGEPCELQLRDDAVIVQQQWEFNRLLIERQPTVIHAAAVARHGNAMLLAGRSHSGKTTLAAWLAAHHGYEYATDEASAIDVDGAVMPYPRPLGLRPESPMARPTSGTAQRFMPDEVLVPVSDVGGVVARTAWPAQLIVFPHFQPESDVRVASVSQADALERLAHLTPGLVRHGGRVFSRLARLVVAARAIDVTYPYVGAAAEAIVECDAVR